MPVHQPVTRDAVVVVPGIMGSELVDATTGDVLWGLRRLGWYVRAWSSGDGLNPLHVTEDELAGRTGRVKATGLLRFPAFAPWLAGLEPYTPLVRRIRGILADPRALLEFAYDWRLPVWHNAELLASAADQHLTAWRAVSGRPDAKLVLVAHSMGGLLCQSLGAISGAADSVRNIITLGTPFDGAAKAAVILNSGRGAPVPRRQLRDLAAGMPGIHDLLPTYRCLAENGTVRRLTAEDVALWGGSAELASNAFSRRRVGVMPGHRALVGIEQPTISSLTFRDGVLSHHAHTFRLDASGDFQREPDGSLRSEPGRGDGTVPRNSAIPPTTSNFVPLAQQHGTLARSSEAIDFACDVILNAEADLGPRLGTGEIGLSAPDLVSPNTESTATVTGVEPHEARCTLTDAETGHPIDHPPLSRRDGEVVIPITVPAPGVYRIEVSGGGTSPVTQLLMAV